MSEVKIQSYQSKNIWLRLPIWVRAILVGFFVNTLGVGTWVVVVTNIQPPWSAFLMVALLVIYFMYYSGSWSSGNRKEFQQACFRKINLSRKYWIWGGFAGLCLLVFLNSGLALTFRFKEFQPEVFKTATYLDTLSPFNTWSLIIVASLVAGICEEVGFRGYMQAPMERKYGPVVGIVITSLVFVVVHLHQAWAPGVVVHIFVVSFMIGYLAYSTNSLIPGIIAHTLFDVVNFSYWWSNVAGTYTYKPIAVTGIDMHFIILALIVAASTLLFAFSIFKMLKLKASKTSLA